MIARFVVRTLGLTSFLLLVSVYGAIFAAG